MEHFPYHFLQVSLLYLSCGLIHCAVVERDESRNLNHYYLYDDYSDDRRGEVAPVVDGNFYPEKGDLWHIEALREGFTELKKALPIVWTQYVNTGGTVGIEARCMTLPNSPQPKSTLPGSKVSLRVKGRKQVLDAKFEVQKGATGTTADDPHFWPLDIWVAKIPIPKGKQTITGARFCNQTLPDITGSPAAIGALGDTGLRVKTVNDGQCSNPSTRNIFGVTAFCSPENRNKSTMSGDFQSLSEWPVQKLSEEMSNHKLDLVLHMGDFVYRQWLCPWRMAGDGCKAINNKGAWGDSVVSWYYELFQPFEQLLAKAPWVMTRGNHEICSRAGTGWTLMLSPDDLNKPGSFPNTHGPNSTYCDGTPHKPMTIAFNNKLEIGFFDTSDLKEVTQRPGKTSIDSYNLALGDKAVPPKGVIELPLTGSKANHNNETNNNDLEYTNNIKALAKQSNKDNFVMMLTHVPVHALVPDGKDESDMIFVGYNANVRKALYDVPDYKPKITFGGHMHWFQRWQSKSTTQFVLGNGGTMLIVEHGVPKIKEGQKIGFLGKNGKVGDTFEGKVVRAFGFSLLNFNSAAGKMNATHYKMTNANGTYKRDATPLDTCIIPPETK